MTKIWYCEEDEAPIPEGEAVEVHLRHDDGETGSEVLCTTHAEARSYHTDAAGEWWALNGDTEYMVEFL